MAALEVKCPQCGGLLAPDEGQRFLVCPYCGSAVFLDKSRVVFHWQLRPTLDEGGAGAALRRWMAGNETVKDLDLRSRVTSVGFAYFPLWLVRLGSDRAETVHLEPAAATSVSELKHLPLPAGDLVRYESAIDAQAVPPTVPVEAMLVWAEQTGLRRDQVSEVSLVHVPLYTFHYDYSGRSYVALVEGVSGKVFANIYPPKAEAPYRAVALAAAVTFLCLAALPLGGAAVEPRQGLGIGILACVALGLVAAPLLFAAAAWIAAKV
jgi:DNA-directed RNA polymerase subunit RPC12/RpoP